MLKRGVSSRVARARVNALCMLMSGAAFLAGAIVAPPALKLMLLAIGGALPLLTFTLGPALVSEIVPPAHRRRLLITVYAGITVAGFVSPMLAGRLIGDRGIAGYDAALLANGAVVVLGGLAALFFIDPERTKAALAR